jgi:hypothetical protein
VTHHVTDHLTFGLRKRKQVTCSAKNKKTFHGINHHIIFPPSKGDQDVSAAENEFTLRIPSIPGWASFINTATHLEELKLAGNAALKVLLKLALNYLLEPALCKYDYPLPPTIWHLKTITFSDMRSPDTIKMITAIVCNLYNCLRNLDEDDHPSNSINNSCENLDGHSCIPPHIILHNCKAVQNKAAVTTRVTGVHPNSTAGVWANHAYNCWNGTFRAATTMLCT